MKTSFDVSHRKLLYNARINIMAFAKLIWMHNKKIIAKRVKEGIDR
jgi:hypothetical protein